MAQDIKKAKEECDPGGKPGPEFVSTVRDGEPNLALLEKATFKILNELGGLVPTTTLRQVYPRWVL